MGSFKLGDSINGLVLNNVLLCRVPMKAQAVEKFVAVLEQMA